ncbi:unnamed protein product [Ectocarpus sp. CCAP 1310/34]|nr:unnamed protein product [Ectocarpus sp. CCAP 1310/34]
MGNSMGGKCSTMTCAECAGKHKKCKTTTMGRWVRLQTSGRPPSPRSGHDVAVIGNKAYLFGGCGGDEDQITCLNDMYVFDLQMHRWERAAPKGDSIHARASFGMCQGPTPGTVIVAGGTGVEMDSLRADVVEYNTRTRTWTSVLTDSEETPCKFYGQSVCTYGDNLLLFGGSTGLHYSNDLFEYNVCSNRWRKLTTTGRKPSPRYKHQAVAVGDKMYVIGGGCFKPEQSSIDLYCLDLKTLVWEMDETEMKGDLPKARVAHSCSFDPVGGDIYLWGGFTGELSRLADFYVYNCKSACWRRLVMEGGDASPPARAFHSAVFHDGALYLFSGANGDIRYNDVWRYQVRGSPPSLAVLASKVLLEESGLNTNLELKFKNKVPDEVIEGVKHMNEYAECM